MEFFVGCVIVHCIHRQKIEHLVSFYDVDTQGTFWASCGGGLNVGPVGFFPSTYTDTILTVDQLRDSGRMEEPSVRRVRCTTRNLKQNRYIIHRGGSGSLRDCAPTRIHRSLEHRACRDLCFDFWRNRRNNNADPFQMYNNIVSPTYYSNITPPNVVGTKLGIVYRHG